MSDLFELYSKLISARSQPGGEHNTAVMLREIAGGLADECFIDTLGNLILHKKGSGKKIMLAAHMDEIGFVVTFIDDKGFLRFGTMGGFYATDLPGTQILFENGIHGLICKEEKAEIKDLRFNDLYIDIGAKSKDDAAHMVKVGDTAGFAGTPVCMGAYVCGPYMDDKIGCVTLVRMLELLQGRDTKGNDIYIVFSVMEEIGPGGAATSTYRIEPDLAYAVDVTDAGDMPGMKHKIPIELGKGPTNKVLDMSIVCHTQARRLLAEAAEKAGVSLQDEVLLFGGTDAGAIHMTKKGVVTGAMSIPARYIHTQNEMVDLYDVESAALVLAELVTTKQ